MSDSHDGPSSEATPRDGDPFTDADDSAELRRQLRRHVVRFCPSWLREHIEDIVQIAWMRLQRARERSERNRTPGATLIARVAFCAAMDESRRLRRRREVNLDAAKDKPWTATEDPSVAAHAGEIRRAIRECLVSIRENRSLAVTLYLQGHTAPQTARLLRWSLTKTENLIYRGLADLRRCLAAKGFTP